MKTGYIFFALIFTLAGVQAQTDGGGYVSTASAIARSGRSLRAHGFMVFPEKREYPVKWTDSVKARWLKEDHTSVPFGMEARPGEYFVFQIAVWAMEGGLQDVQVHFSDLGNASGEKIASGGMTCFNSGGIDMRGKPFSRRIDVASGQVQPLWMGIHLPAAAQGRYSGLVSISAGGVTRKVMIRLDVSGKALTDQGVDDARRLARLQWLNGRAGLDAQVTKGYIPVQREGSLVSILGRSMCIGDDGLPVKITSYFTPSNQSIAGKGMPVIDAPFRLIIEKEDGAVIRLHPGRIQFTSQAPSYVTWRSVNTSADCDVVCDGRMEFDGYVDYHLTVRARKDLPVKDIRLEADMDKGMATYMMGLNRSGGLRPDVWDWKWDTAARDQDAVWLGAVNGGLRFKWKGDGYVPPLVNVYYAFDRLHLPPSWGNGGRGGVRISEEGDKVLVNAYSGRRVMRQGEKQHYDFELLITPFRTLNKAVQFGARYYQSELSSGAAYIRAADSLGANIINVHQGNDLYPFINYPYSDVNVAALKDFVTAVHRDHKRAKVYYTTRELTVNLPELWPFVSLGDEIIYPGPGASARTITDPEGPDPWLKKQLRGRRYIPAWVSHFTAGKYAGMQDLSVITTPDSRLNNFYVSGLEWMVRHLRIDGIYIDDCSMDRTTIRRARKVLDRSRPDANIDMHSWDHYNPYAGWASCVNLYMDLLPYIDQLWIGEARNYDTPPDYWLTEISGIPFGLPGQMLQDGGNPWRGMVYGMTNRAGWTGAWPDPIWHFWDRYDIRDMTMQGYWEADNPVTVDNDSVKATLYHGKKESIIAVANFGRTDQLCSLDVDLQRLGFAGGCIFSIPGIAGYQREATLASLKHLMVPGGKGYLVVLHARE